MSVFKAYGPGVKVNGETVLSVVHGLGAFKKKAVEILADNGIENPEPGKWYSQQSWLNAFEEISAKLGSATLFSIGTKITENAKFPPQIDSIESGLAAIDKAYKMNHKDGEIGEYAYTKTGDRSAKMVCRNPYPCDFDRGIITAMSRKFADKGAVVKVIHDNEGPCRKEGGEYCTYFVSW